MEGDTNHDLALAKLGYTETRCSGNKMHLAKGPKQGTKQLQGGFLEPGQRLATQPNKPIAFLKQFYHITTCYNRVFLSSCLSLAS